MPTTAAAPASTAPTSSSPTARLRGQAREAEARLEQTLRGLAESVDSLAANQQFRNLLIGRMRLLYYGNWNQQLILIQCPRATWVQGPRQWERLGRKVKPDAKGINILAPSRAGQAWPFKVVQVFDVAQTDGPNIPRVGANYRGDASRLADVEAAAKRLGIRVTEVDEVGFEPGAEILAKALGGEIVVRKHLRPAERIRVLVHEYAHELLHLAKSQRDRDGRPMGDVALRETEADATAFVVLGAMGIEYNCPPYIVWQGGSGKAILQSIKRILAAARAITTAIDGQRPRIAIRRLRVEG